MHKCTVKFTLASVTQLIAIDCLGGKSWLGSAAPSYRLLYAAKYKTTYRSQALHAHTHTVHRKDETRHLPKMLGSIINERIVAHLYVNNL